MPLPGVKSWSPNIPYSQGPWSLDGLTPGTEGQADIVLLGGKALTWHWESWSQAEGSWQTEGSPGNDPAQYPNQKRHLLPPCKGPEENLAFWSAGFPL